MQLRFAVAVTLIFASMAVAPTFVVAEPPDEPNPSSPASPRAGSILPKPGAPDPAPFTLVDRYFDAARRGDAAIVERCLAKGVDPIVVDEVGRSALLMAVRDGRSLPVVKLLAERGVSVTRADARGRTPLADASALGEVEIAAYLLSKGADVNRKDKQGQAPLYNAVLSGSIETVRLLIDAGAKLDTADRYGDTPLMGACNRNDEDVARLLVEKGADVSLRDQENRSAADRAPVEAAYCRSLGAASE